MRVFINPGHAKSGDPGACGHGLQENIVALNIGEKVFNLLKAQGDDVSIFQIAVDSDFALQQICDASNLFKPDIFISIHCNSAANPAANGTETFSMIGSTYGAKLAGCINWRICDRLPELTPRGTKTANFYVLTHTDAPAVLVETAFICNEKDARILRERQDDFAIAIVDGINDYFAVKKNDVVKPAEEFNIAVLTHRYESNGNPAAVSNISGSISYGLYQFNAKIGIVQQFVDWLIEYPDDSLANFGRELSNFKINSPLFISKWKEIGTVHAEKFGRLQDEFAAEMYFNPACKILKNNFYNVENHSAAIKAVIFSRAIQNGITGCSIVLKLACARLGYPNLSYVDDKAFDAQLIAAVYDFLISECDNAQPSGGIYRSANNLVRGSAAVVAALRQRFTNEKADALNLL